MEVMLVVMEAVMEASSLEVELSPAHRGGDALASASETQVDLQSGAAGYGSLHCVVQCSLH